MLPSIFLYTHTQTHIHFHIHVKTDIHIHTKILSVLLIPTYSFCYRMPNDTLVNNLNKDVDKRNAQLNNMEEAKKIENKLHK